MTARPPPPGRQSRLARRLAWLAVATGILRSRSFQGQVLVGAVVLAALAGFGRGMRTRAWARTRAWLRKIDQRAERASTAKRR